MLSLLYPLALLVYPIKIDCESIQDNSKKHYYRADLLICRKCGHRNRTSDRYCRRCGASLKK